MPTRLHSKLRSSGTGEWTAELRGVAVEQGMSPIDPRDFLWPLAPRGLVVPRREARSGATHHFLRRSQTMSTPSFSARTTLAGMLLVDVPDQAVVDRVADQLLQAPGEGLTSAGEPELLVLLLADVAGAVVHGDADATLRRGVGAAAVPQAADPDEHAALGHLRGDRVVVLERVGRRRRAGGSRARGGWRRSPR